ncbi:hypothetical protein ACIBKY_32735 [Nonomuraea sp. NPDC050394]|uniref:hypothetical protein n=1 Tax=Nonomuraea sp. NPDC050394 TaxID=3364363 RepID=UPI0037A6E2C3
MAWDWSTVRTSSGGSEEIPATLERLLAGETEAQRDRAFDGLYSAVVNQGDLETAAAPVADRILEELGVHGSVSEYGWLMLNCIFGGAGYGKQVLVDGSETDLESYCRQTVIASLPMIGPAAAAADGETFRFLTVLLGKVGEYAPEAISILEREVRVSSGERLVAASDGLEVARELAAERAADG